MNPYSPDIIKKDLCFRTAEYHINRHSHEESLSVSFLDSNTRKDDTIYFIKKAAMHTGIMEILDYDIPEKESSLAAFENLNSTLPLLGIHSPFKRNDFIDYCSKCTVEKAEILAVQVMPILQTCFEMHPLLSYLYPLYYALMRSCYLCADMSPNMNLKDTAAIAEILSEEVKSLCSLYTQARNYLDAVIIQPAQAGKQFPSSVTAEIHHSYCLYANQPDFLSEALSSMELKTAFLPDASSGFPLSNARSETQNWLAYLDKASSFMKENTITKYPITSFRQLLYIGIRQLLEDELIIRKCKLCNGYFRVKYTSNQEYCTRIYRDTSTTCNEYASRKSYKEKLFSHPIHTEFTKAYNRLYARIRRGKLPADTPLMDQLKALHDEYTEKYENTHQKDREAIWKEYIEKNKELLK